MRWTIKPKPDPNKVARLSKELVVDDITSFLLIQRGIETFEEAKDFFRPDLKDLHDPFLMKDMDKAVARIEEAILNKENILVYGDYDVDGTTSVALMSSYLLTYYSNVATYIPDRYDEGYGISYKGIDFAEDNNFSLIIALDCGIKAIDKVDYASKKAIDFIICDHHRPGTKIPNAKAILDPKRDDCNYPFKELCGCGVGFKLIQALASKKGETIEDLLLYLDLVATAIGADIVPIVDENRILAFHGLKVINQNPRPGFKAIIEQVKKGTLTITDVVFIIAPRINAAGRMKHGNHAVTLLCETDINLATQYANEIDTYNSDRRDTDKRITIEALDQLEELKEQEGCTTVVYKENWHKGVIGIVASRLIETYYRPTLVFTKSGDVLAASARSVKGFDVYNALEQCSEFIEQFGGHKYAAGLTLLEANYGKFKAQFEKVVSETIDPKLLIPEISIDSQLNLTDITPKFYRIISQFAPFGPGNMTPVFMTEDMQDTGYGKQVGEDKTHLRLTATQNGKGKLVGIGFGLGDQTELIKNKKTFKAAYTIDENEWNGNVSLQLKLKDIKP
ncbi:MAG: single-stranded-DNA-specific exonuclease RecJ [Flavobacteriaceae bacterium]|jgi:single-stranded-DNA-specific exonuclease|nr:single-stranded-DNA-specific exonuclease RecJ [Flavobacteriaceae bacterium]MBT3918782.1 single-stranded-DNA-specific exonuclease RecJ [Flavobacteriaceae bacterium]MBT6706145.1 single-stranded-DNA-specific exonuclease RecJ [Flavobacteriaceae bacterium]MBT7241993.1 single-stranded-DNA-specific exonuclease RecJ [Flavobacteriaceae bacterium]|tara:strand:+ start:180 stop:1871 length:1692 start_codon:yes stop_codon:yes gene_type:complete